MANGNAPPPPQPPGGSMMMMLMVMILMTLLIMNPGIRSTMGGIADPILSPVLPEESFFIVTAFNSWDILNADEYSIEKFLLGPD